MIGWYLRVSVPGLGPGVHSEAAGLHLHQERTELAGWPDARVEEEEAGGRTTRGAIIIDSFSFHQPSWYLCSRLDCLSLLSLSSGGAQYYCRGRRNCTGASGGELQVNHTPYFRGPSLLQKQFCQWWKKYSNHFSKSWNTRVSKYSSSDKKSRKVLHSKSY